MNISLQLIELPDNEQVVSRQITLPNSGGTIGRSYECTVQLPDHSCTLSRVHIEITPLKVGGFQVTDRSVNGCQVNGVDLGQGQSVKLNDGDNIRIGGYLMLVSNMDELFSSGSNHQDSSSRSTNLRDSSQSFDFESVMEEPTEAFFSVNEISAAEHESEPEDFAFSHANAMGEDLYAYDPFDDGDVLSMVEDEPTPQGDVIMFSERTEKENEKSDENALTLANRSQVQKLDTSIARLTQLVEHQQTALGAAIDRERLFSCIEVTLDKFLDEFNPQALEDEFNDYISGWGNKDKKYWSLYKKQFMRKQKKKEFKRQFTALLMDELREK
ncbi:type VI secretion system-associated FHA domain protein [Vibrio fluminensis]|uniref:type VI secretion system-associated FHA domain protein n=1 Tax=Vibrio fluminensis TaxID=2783614 RepID=UPI0018889F13|nr:FHA domain-containing protein [Vibrio fluminensis]